MQPESFSHLDERGNPSMVDVGDKLVTLRTARAQSVVVLNEAVLKQFENEEIRTKKGPVFQTAILAGIMAVKKTSDLIPLCHPLPIDKIGINIRLNEKKEVEIECMVRVTAKTGVEMEALTGASVAALTVYDMCKAFGHDMEIRNTRLLEKTGGKSDFSR
ncbi:MAG TPA: cyclic pyranopterin monophosphate synthase MoaC [Flavilitoribacter sp.]|mgnify:CR=1 FL=1|nr:cyclic pyranopterin monophosphate synthase MoaC [Flavilitoribacter sp.]HMQ88054.1 cyclic pyranopterin monophosphate synthase MoaC [Flavilitoribacter sp.]